MRRPCVPISLGERFNRWTVIGADTLKGVRRYVPVQCDCGTHRTVLVTALRTGQSKSCGCLKREQVATLVSRTRWADAHGMGNHPLYSTWHGMMTRCHNAGDAHYPRWGGRGIKVCGEWHDPRIFIAWIEANLGPRAADRSIDRIDNDGHYEPGNVRWATRSQQQRNRRNSRRR